MPPCRVGGAPEAEAPPPPRGPSASGGGRRKIASSARAMAAARPGGLDAARDDVAFVVERAADVLDAVALGEGVETEAANKACQEAVDAMGRVRTALRQAAADAQTHVGGAGVHGRRDAYVSRLELQLARSRAALLARQAEALAARAAAA